jgi:hypothetical protein
MGIQGPPGVSQWSDNPVGIHYVSGSVGIGTSAPTNTLDVDGTLRVRSATILENVVGIDGDVNLTSGHKLGIGVNPPQSELDVEGSVWIENNAASSSTALEVHQHASNDGIFSELYAGNYNAAVWGETHSSNTAGIAGFNDGEGPGVYGESESEGVAGNSTGPDGQGVSGQSTGPNGSGVSGQSTGYNGKGVYGSTTSPTGWGGLFDGPVGSTQIKNFIQPHPTDPAKEIRFICLEGNEAGTYFRGSGRTVGGRAEIDVPEDFRLASEGTALTVQITPFGAPALVWVESKDLDRIAVRSNVDVDFDYLVNGVRRGYANQVTITDNQGYVPTVRAKPFGTQYPQAIRDLLVANGILNADYTPNEATAARLGWQLQDEEDGRQPRDWKRARREGAGSSVSSKD